MGMARTILKIYLYIYIFKCILHKRSVSDYLFYSYGNSLPIISNIHSFKNFRIFYMDISLRIRDSDIMLFELSPNTEHHFTFCPISSL